MKKRAAAWFLILLLALSAVPVTAEGREWDGVGFAVFYTNDIHGYLDKNLTYATVSGLKAEAQAALGEENVMLVDAGDHSQGSVYVSADGAEHVYRFMEKAGYDFAIPGNHEFDQGMEAFLKAAEETTVPYISCNFTDLRTGETVFKSYEITEMNGCKVGFLGISTPDTVSSARMSNFQNENGEFIYDFCVDSFYETVQKNIDAIRAEGADFVLAVSHLGHTGLSEKYSVQSLVKNTEGLDVIMDGHSHTTVEGEKVTDRSGREVLVTQTGCYFSAIGCLTYDGEAFSTRLITESTACDESLRTEIEEWVARTDADYESAVAECAFDMRITDPEGNRLVRKTETNMGDLVADAFLWKANEEGFDCNLAIVNSGSIRADVPAGTWTYQDCKKVQVFSNYLMVCEITGQQLLDALEYGTRNTPDKETGGFLQVSGCRYAVDISQKSTVTENEYGGWGGSPASYRVYDVTVYDGDAGKYLPLDLQKTYRISSFGYTLQDGGDGMTMFQGAKPVADEVMEDWQVLASYLQAFEDTDGDGIADISSASSPLSEPGLNYECLTGSGRILLTDGRTERTTVPDTGESNEIIWFIALPAALCGLIAVSRITKKKKGEKEC